MCGFEKANRLRSRLWLLAPAVVLYTSDVVFTLAGQPEAYWAGDHSTALEANPLVYPLLVRNPWLFTGVAGLWLTVVVVVVMSWQHLAIRWLAVLTAMAHAFGGACWVARLGTWGLIGACLYLAVVVAASRWCWRRSVAAAVRRHHERP